MNLPILLLIALPVCIAQVRIVGPSDGHRSAQGLSVEEGKGIQYTEQDDEPVDQGQHFIQGATSGPVSYSAPAVGPAGPSVAAAPQYAPAPPQYAPAPAQYAPAPAQYAPAPAQYGAYNPAEKSLNYNDDSGFKLNWRSYDRAQQRAQPEAQYSEDPVIQRAPPQRHRGHVHPQPQPQPQPQLQAEAVPRALSFNAAPAYLKDLVRYQDQLPFYNNFLIPARYDQGGAQGEPQGQVAQEPRRPYRGKARVQHRQRRQAHQGHRAGPPPPEPAGPPVQYHNQLPSHFQQLIQAQSQIPYINGIPEQFRYNPDFSVQKQQIQSYFQNLKVNPQPPPLEQSLQSRPEPRPGHRQKRQAQDPQQQPQLPSADPQIHYSTNIPGHLRELLKFQADIANNIIPNQVPYNTGASFVPQPAQAPAPQQVQYQPQGSVYQGQPSGQAYADQPQYQPQYQSQIQREYEPQYRTQYPAGYQQPSGDIRPVTENQY